MSRTDFALENTYKIFVVYNDDEPAATAGLLGDGGMFFMQRISLWFRDGSRMFLMMRREVDRVDAEEHLSVVMNERIMAHGFLGNAFMMTVKY